VSSFCLDAHFTNQALGFEPFNTCLFALPGCCGLAPIFLLHSMHQDGPLKRSDVFLILWPVPSADRRQNCHQRIGLMLMTSEDPDAPSWVDVVQAKTGPLREESWFL